jgi:hypothetical protein
MDPVKLHLLGMRSEIPADVLRSMTDQIMPGARRQRLVQILICIFGFIFVGGGTVAYFKFFSTWRGLDPVLATIYSIQFVAILSGPFIGFWVARSKYIGRIKSVMLEHQHCPHCGYDLHGLPRDEMDQATVCPECGCAWTLSPPNANPGDDGHG